MKIWLIGLLILGVFLAGYTIEEENKMQPNNGSDIDNDVVNENFYHGVNNSNCSECYFQTKAESVAFPKNLEKPFRTSNFSGDVIYLVCYHDPSELTLEIAKSFSTGEVGGCLKINKNRAYNIDCGCYKLLNDTICVSTVKVRKTYMK